MACSLNAKNHVRHHHHYTTSLSASGHALASCAFCNTCSLLSSRNKADPIGLFQPAGCLLAAIAARRTTTTTTGLQRDCPTRPSQLFGWGPGFDFWLLQPAVASPPILPCRLPPLPCPLPATASVAAWSRPKLSEDRVVRLCPKQQSSGGSIPPVQPACLLWIMAAALGRASWAWKLPAIHPCRVLARH